MSLKELLGKYFDPKAVEVIGGFLGVWGSPSEEACGLVPRQLTTLEEKYLSLWRRLSPENSYIQGISADEGLLFDNSTQHITRMTKEIDTFRAQLTSSDWATVSLRKILLSTRFELTFEEPHQAFVSLTGTFDGYFLKHSGKIPIPTLRSLYSQGNSVLSNSFQRARRKQWSLPLRLLLIFAASGFFKIMSSLPQTPEKNSLLATAQLYVSQFRLRGENKDQYLFTKEAFRRNASKRRSSLLMGRKRVYPRVLRDVYDYGSLSDPAVLLKQGLQWLREEMPLMRKLTQQLAELFGAEPKMKAVRKHMEKLDKLEPSRLVEMNRTFRDQLVPLLRGRLVNIPRGYSANIEPTPKYLESSLPSAAATAYDQLTPRPQLIYYITTNPKLEPFTSLAELLRVWVHEDLGHDLHFHNVAVSRLTNKYLHLKLPNSFGDALSEGIAFDRERQLIEVMKGSPELRSYLEKIRSSLPLELEWEVQRGRIVRFLRIIGDVTLNTDQMTLPEFLVWAKKNTGVGTRTMFYELFPAHEANGPGYATTYGVVGQQLRDLQTKLGKSKSMPEFNDRAMQLGYLPTSIFLATLNS